MRNETASRLSMLSPTIYEDFHCIADNCSMTCCQEWIIHVDDLTLHRWQNTELEGHLLSRTVEKDPNGTHRIRLQEDHRCPWLNSEGLCRLVLNFGDGMLSQTCASFPRQVLRYADRLERNLLTGCPEVLDRIRESGTYDMTWRVNGSDADHAAGSCGSDCLGSDADYAAGSCGSGCLGSDADYAAGSCGSGCLGSDAAPSPSLPLVDEDDRLTLHALRLIREGICRLLAEETQSIESTLALAFYLLTELWEHEPEADVAEELLHAMTVPEELTRICHRLAILPQPVSSPESLTENNELFLDLCENYMQERRYGSVLEPLYRRAQEFAEAPADDLACSRKDDLRSIGKVGQKAADGMTDIVSGGMAGGMADIVSSGIDDGTAGDITDGITGDIAGRTSDGIADLCAADRAVFDRNLPLRQILIADCRAALLSEDPHLDDMILNFQWISLRYAAIRHGLLLMDAGNSPAGSKAGASYKKVSRQEGSIREVVLKVAVREDACREKVGCKETDSEKTGLERAYFEEIVSEKAGLEKAYFEETGSEKAGLEKAYFEETGSEKATLKEVSGSWPAVRRLICVIERMTGCSEEDSHVYLTELFPGGRFGLAYLRFLLGV